MAVTVIESLIDWQDTANEEPLWVELRNLRIADERRPHQTTMRKVHSTDRTTIRRLTTPTVDALLNEQTLMNCKLYTRDFQRLSSRLPFSISIAGVASHLQHPTETESGQQMRRFRLVDLCGKYVDCVAFGRQAENTLIAEGNDIIIYFASALEGLRMSTGSLWLYDECHVVLQRGGCVPPQLRQHMELRSKSSA